MGNEVNNNEDYAFEKLLNDFISSQLQDVEDVFPDNNDDEASAEEDAPSGDKTLAEEKQDDNDSPEFSILRPEERALARAYQNFSDAISLISDEFNLPFNDFQVTPEMLSPNYKPSIGQKIAEDTISGWDILIKAFPKITTQISPDASDEKLLEFAENCTHETLQFAIISYVEILIEMEGCEISYKERKLRKEKRKLEREVYMEHQRRAQKIKAYIDAIKEKSFPIDAERLVKNFFKTSDKDPQGAFRVLTENPAVFAPIDFSKIKPRFFGLLKVTPQDGIRMNRLIGNFLKNLKL